MSDNKQDEIKEYAEGWITEKDLVGLGAEKLELIRRGAGTVRELDA